MPQLRPAVLSFLALFLAGLIATPPASAHLLNMTRIDAQVRGNETHVSIEIDLGQSLMSAEAYWEATRAAPAEQATLLAPALRRLDRELVMLVDGEPRGRTLSRVEIAATSLDAIANPLTPQMATLHYVLPSAGGERLQIELAPGLDIPWPCLLTLRTPDAGLPQSRLLTDVDRRSHPALLRGAPENAGNAGLSASLLEGWSGVAPWMMWVAVGFQHIIPKGLDHILFMLGLFFVSGGWRPLLIQVTGFTLAHSVTLALSMYGVVQVPASIVEPLIALSIVYVALDNLSRHPLARWRLAVIMLFGLLHGLGFAAVLADIGLPREQFLSSLLLFNLGVELGQLAVLLLAFSLAGWFRRQPWYAGRVAQPAAVAIAGTGLYWFLKRIAL